MSKLSVITKRNNMEENNENMFDSAKVISNDMAVGIIGKRGWKGSKNLPEEMIYLEMNGTPYAIPKSNFQKLVADNMDYYRLSFGWEI